MQSGGEGAGFITFRLTSETGNHTELTHNGLATEAERDKSRPYACRKITPLSRLVEDTKLKGMFLVTLTI